MTQVDIIQISIGISQTIATVLISVVLYRQAKLFKKIEVQSNTSEAFNVLNTIAISSEENLQAFDSIGRNNFVESPESRRKRWCAFVWLQALQQTFTAMEGKMIDSEYALQTLDQQLNVILKDDDVYWLVCFRGFNPKFVKYCSNIRSKIGMDVVLPYNMHEMSKNKNSS